MPTQSILIRTWYCPICNYKQDTDPYDANIQHHDDYFPQVPLGMCVPGWLARQTEPSHHEQNMGLLMDQQHIASVSGNDGADIAAMTVIDADANGQAIMIDSGQVKQEIGIIDGKPAVVETPIFVEKTRELTPAEQQAKLDDANKAIDDISTKEFDPRQV